MLDDSGSVAISFNGEIYNYRALRTRLEQRGHHFRSDSDTEVLLHLYDELGPAMVNELRGMFAFAIWDGRRRGLLLARDPFGIKPLYYADTGRHFLVASEVKALRHVAGVDTSPNAAGHVGFFLWGHVPEPHTLYRGIRSVEAGNTLWIDEHGSSRCHRYADIAELFASNDAADGHSESGCNGADVIEELRDALLDSVRHHMVADVDVGVFLSAGLDSTTIAALATESGNQLRTVTLGFSEFKGTTLDETVVAEQVARHYGTVHQTIWVSAQEFQRELPQLVARMDQPSIDGVNSYFVSRAARQSGLKVALSGLGGDELFGGYSSFTQVPRLVNALRHVPAVATLGRGFRIISAPLVRRVTSPKYAGVLEYGARYSSAYLLRRGLFLPWELQTVMDADMAREGWRELALPARLDDTVRGLTTDRHKMSTLEAAWYMRNQLLRDTDWASMSHSLEVRVPFVDVSLWKAVARLLRAYPELDKRSMASAARPALPPSVMRRRKTGFFIPVREWMSRDDPHTKPQRGLRGWAQYVHAHAAA